MQKHGLALGAISCAILLNGSCKTRSNPGELKEFWLSLLDTKEKRVEEISDQNEFITTFALLPLAGRLSPKPWTIKLPSLPLQNAAYRWNAQPATGAYAFQKPGALKDSQRLSPLEKYDLLLGNKDWELTRNELKKESRDLIEPIDWAVASIIYAEPGAVTMQGESGQAIPFHPNDIKILLSRHVHRHAGSDDGVATVSLGSLCRWDSDEFRQQLRPNAAREAEEGSRTQPGCFSVDAAAFHIALANTLGFRGESFLIDPKRDDLSTQRPVAAYQSQVIASSQNSDGRTELEIATTLTLITPQQSGLKATSAPSEPSVVYHYRLLLDEEGAVQSGSWITSEAPEIIWTQSRPQFAREDQKLEALYTASVSLPARMAMRDFNAQGPNDARIKVRDSEPLVVNRRYRFELTGDVPHGADGLKTFLKTALRTTGPLSIFRSTFTEEESVASIDVQFHQATTFPLVKQAIKAHSNGRTEIIQIFR